MENEFKIKSVSVTPYSPEESKKMIDNEPKVYLLCPIKLVNMPKEEYLDFCSMMTVSPNNDPLEKQKWPKVFNTIPLHEIPKDDMIPFITAQKWDIVENAPHFERFAPYIKTEE